MLSFFILNTVCALFGKPFVLQKPPEETCCSRHRLPRGPVKGQRIKRTRVNGARQLFLPSSESSLYYSSASDCDKPWRSRKQHHHFNSHLPPLRTVPVDLHPSTVCRNQAWAWLPSPPPPPSLSWCVSQHLRWLLWLFGQHGFHLSSLLPATIPEDHTGIIVAGATGDLGRHGIRVHRHG